MPLQPWKLFVAAALIFPAHAFAQEHTDQKAYCSYVLEQAQAQRDLLRTPTAVVGMTQPETGLPLQVVGGATLGLSSVRKASLTMEAARKECELYKTTTETQQALQYAIPSIEREALRNRLSLIQSANKSLEELIEKTTKMLEARNATRVMLFSLQTTKIKLDTDRADTNAKLSAIYVPELNDKPLKALVAEKESSEAGEQQAQDKLSRQNNWDVALSVGVHQQANPVAQGAQPYGEVSINYNFASRAINKHLDRAAEAHDEWKRGQESDVVRGSEILRQQLAEILSAQEGRLKSVQEESKLIDQNLDAVANPDTSAALDFSNQLTAARLLLEIEAGDARFRLEHLRQFLAKNF